MTQTTQKETGKLYMVATPIGNLEDITLRAIRVLKEVDLIAAEDTRHTRRLLSHFGIHTRLISYYREKEQERGRELVKRMQGGEDVALVSDAGSPGISDPGSVVVRMARDVGIRIIPIPGPSALTAALSVAGFDYSTFLFLGFAPPKTSKRRKLLHSLKNSEHPLVFYESVHRFHNLLHDCLDILGDRKAFMAREISKVYEELQHLSLSQLCEQFGSGKNKGEFVLIIYPGKLTQATGENLDELIIWYRENSEMTLKDVSKKLAADLGLSRSQVYKKALLLWNKKTSQR